MIKSQAGWTATDLGQLGVPAVLNTLADGAYVTDIDRRIIFWNEAASRITGWPAAAVVGRSCSDNLLVHIDKDGRPLCGKESCPLHRSIVTGHPSSTSLLVFAQKQDGTRIPVEVTVAPLRDAHGQVVAGIELFRDLTTCMEDLLRAQLIQESALQCPVPADARVRFEFRYTPNDIVGGDFYRVEQVDADRYTILVADVMGHGVAAALYTMQLRSLWEDWREELNYPGAFLGRINQRLHALARAAGYFATAVCVHYNAATGAVRYVRAGHPSPLLARAAGALESLAKQQPALGMFPDLRYEESATQLAPGDALLLFTDGALEVTNTAGEELGQAGLEQIWRAEANGAPPATVDLANLEERLLRFSNQIHLPDDLTLFKVTRQVCG